MIRELRVVDTTANDRQVFRVISSLGGRRGWLAWNWAWKIRGLIDLTVGGPGLRRGRRHETDLDVGETIDFWRVEALDPGRRLRLEAEMRVPGRAWLEWTVDPTPLGARLRQVATFDPDRWWGTAYWYALYPIHSIMFSRLAAAITREAERLEAQQKAGSPC